MITIMITSPKSSLSKRHSCQGALRNKVDSLLSGYKLNNSNWL